MFNIRRVTKIAIALLSISLSNTISAAPKSSPFGIAQGASIKSLNIIRAYNGSQYVVTPPIKNLNFVKYIVLATPKSGVCAIFALSEDYKSADDIKTKFDSIVRLLSIYGKSHTVKFSSEWPISDLTARYFPVEWKTALPNGLGSIVVEPIKRDSTYKIEVSYIYRNFKSCSNWEPNQDRRGL